MSKVILPTRVRFAPSPTGELHLGSARTALYNFLFARNTGGQLILRIEDTDRDRYVAGSMERFLDDLAWLGINFDEGPAEGGAYSPYVQSSRVISHQKVASQLVELGAAYYDFSSPSSDGGYKDEDYKSGRAVFRSPDRELSLAEAKKRLESGEKAVIRLKVPAGSIGFVDEVRGKVEFDLETVDDAVLLKSDAFPTYHLANVVDDHEMRVTHVLRAEEWLSSTPKHLLIYRALNWEPPKFAHLPLILAPDKKKLSKRVHGDSVWVRTYREQGYLPEALVNYLALLGWNPGGDQEILSVSELEENFSLNKVHKAGAIFDQQKLDHFQNTYVRKLSIDKLLTSLSPFLSGNIEPNLLRRLATVSQSRLVRLGEFEAAIFYFLQLPAYPKELLVFKKSTYEATLKGLTAAHRALEKLDSAGWENIETIQNLLGEIVDQTELANGDVFWPIRVSLTGQEKSPSPSECLWVLGREESLQRIGHALEKLQRAA